MNSTYRENLFTIQGTDYGVRPRKQVKREWRDFRGIAIIRSVSSGTTFDSFITGRGSPLTVFATSKLADSGKIKVGAALKVGGVTVT